MTERHAGTPCPGCGAMLTVSFDVRDKPHYPRPRPGDSSICMKCGEILVYREGLRLERPNTDDRAAWARQDGFLTEMAKMRIAVLKTHHSMR